MITALMMRASWPPLSCPKYGAEHNFFYDLGAFYCEGCGDELGGFLDAAQYQAFMRYVYFYGTPQYVETANKWN